MQPWTVYNAYCASVAATYQAWSEKLVSYPIQFGTWARCMPPARGGVAIRRWVGAFIPFLGRFHHHVCPAVADGKLDFSRIMSRRAVGGAPPDAFLDLQEELRKL
jgi:hypothetical protein